MAVKQKPSVFESSDGQEFATEKEAKEHDELVEAVREYRASRDRLNHLIADRQLTADGERFDLTYWGCYYFPLKRFDGVPRVWPVRCGYGTELSLDGPECNDVAVVIRDEKTQQAFHYRIAELYRHEKNAQGKLIVMLSEHIGDVKKELSEVTKKVNG